MGSAALAFLCAFGLAVGMVAAVRKVSLRLGLVKQPRQDRWHRQPTPTLGGVGIFLGALGGVLLVSLGAESGRDLFGLKLPSVPLPPMGIVVGAILIFLIGLWDDLRPLLPQVKLGGQILTAVIVVALGSSTQFFTPRLANPWLAQILNTLLTVFWLVGICNAINLLDNMDGLAGGIATITAGILSFFFWRSQDFPLLLTAMAIAGAAAGFLVFNFPPARIFMGDSGSLFLGFTLALLAIVRKPQASNVFAVLAVPSLLFLLPILDTSLVTITRLLRGQSPAQGGRDHTSHRLIAFGLSERQTVLILYGVAALSGVLAASLEAIAYWFSLALVPLVILGLALLTAYLGGIKVVAGEGSPSTVADAGQPQTKTWRAIAPLMIELTFRRRLLEVGLDFFLFGLVYYLAVLTRYGLVMTEARLELFLHSWPIAVGGAYLSALLTGVYRGVWRYIGLAEMVQYLKASILTGLLLVIAVQALTWLGWVDWTPAMSPVVYVLYTVFLFLGFLATRLSFRFLDFLVGKSHLQGKGEGDLLQVQRVAIYGAGDAGELALRWIWARQSYAAQNPMVHSENDQAVYNWQVVGFLDEDVLRHGRQIHGVTVWGGLQALEEAVRKKRIQGVLLAGIPGGLEEQVKAICLAHQVWVQKFVIGIEPLH